MSTRDPNHRHTALAGGGLVVLAVLCCAVPLLIVAGALGALGAGLVNPWVIGAAAVALLLAAMAWSVRRRRGSTRHDSCCPPVPPGRDQSDTTNPSSTPNQEP